MANLILGSGEFGQGLKFEARGSAHRLSHGPVYGSAGYLALRLGPNYSSSDTTVHLMQSTDGITWTEQAHNINLTIDQISGIAYVNGMYVVYGIEESVPNTSFYARINTSTDGVNWTSYRSSATIAIRNIAGITYANSMWQIFGGGFGRSYSSTNLTTWTARLNYTPPNGASYTFTSGLITDFATSGVTTVVVGYMSAFSDTTGNFIGDETMYFKTDNGTTWTSGSIVGGVTVGGDGWRPTGVAFGNSTWVAVGTTGKIYSSTDGLTWTARTSGTTGDIANIAFANGIFVAERFTSSNTQGSVQMLTSTNGINWSIVEPPVIESDDVLYLSNGAPALDTKPVYALSKWLVSDYQSTDNGLTWTIVDYQLPNKQPFIKYPYESGWNTWKTMDFWVFIPQHPQQFTGMAIASERGSWTVYLETQSTGSLIIKYRGYNITFADANITSTFVFGQWNHFRLVVDNGIASWYLNGTRRSTINSGTRLTGNDTLNIGYSAWIAENQYSRPVDYYIDEFMLTDEALNPTSATSITVPTAPFVNNEFTSILLHFDTNFEDDTGTPARNTGAGLTSAFDQVSDIAVIRSAQASISAIITQAAIGSLVKSTSISLSSEFSLSTSALDLDLAQVDLVVESTLVADVGVIQQGAAEITAEFAIDAANGRIVPASASLEVNAFELIAVGRVQQFGAFIEVQSQLTANVIKAAEAPTEIVSTSSLELVINKIVQNSAAIEAAFACTLDADKVKTFISTEPVTTELTAVAEKITDVIANIELLSSLELIPNNNQAGSGTLFNQCTMTITAQVTSSAEANLSSNIDMLAITNNVVRAEAALVVTAFELVVNKKFNLDESAVWIVPSENTFWTIAKDNTDYLIKVESREYKI